MKAFLSTISLALVVLLTGCGSESAVAPADPTDGGDAAQPDAPNEVYTMRVATIYGPGSAAQDMLDWWVEEVEQRSEGRIDAEIFYGASLLSAADTLPGLREGRAEAGLLIPAYNPAELPLMQLGMVPGSGENNEAHARALHELNLSHQAFQDEIAGNGVRIMAYNVIGNLGTVATPEPITDIGQLNGMTLRALGPVATAMQLVGVEPVAIEAQEVYEAIQRGVIDGTTGLPLEVIAQQGIEEVAPWVLEMQFGFWGIAAVALNPEFWDSLPEDIQQIMLEVSEEYIDTGSEIMMDREAAACDTLIEAGGGVTTLPSEQVDGWLEQVGDSMMAAWRQDTAAAGVALEDIASFEAAFIESHAGALPSAEFVDGLAACRERTPSPS